MRRFAAMCLGVLTLSCKQGPAEPTSISNAKVSINEAGTELSVGFGLTDKNGKPTLVPGGLRVSVEGGKTLCQTEIFVDPAHPPSLVDGLYEAKGPVDHPCPPQAGDVYTARLRFLGREQLLEKTVPASFLLPGKPVAAEGTVKIAPKHAVGQRYGLTYSSADNELGTSKAFKGTATVTAATAAETHFDVALDELSWTTFRGPKKSASGVKLSVTRSPESVDAEVTSPGTAGGAAQMELTSFENMLGALCQPPSAQLVTGKPQKLEGSTWELVSLSGDVAQIKSTPAANEDPFTCEVTVSISDGYTGQRTSQTHIEIKDPATGKTVLIEQRSTLTVELLK